jgi:hypothetical protein
LGGLVNKTMEQVDLVQTLVNKEFGFGVASSNGLLSSDWLSLSRFDDLDLAHKHSWINAKCDSDLRHLVKHFLSVYTKSPYDTSACLLLSHPKQVPKEWLKGWRTVLTIPRGGVMVSIDQEGKPTISSAKHELRVLYYGPIPEIDSITKVDSSLASLRSAPLKMLFAGRAANQTANILFNSGASTCFVSNQFCGLAGIVTEPTEGLTKLGNNHRVPVLGKARVDLKLGALQRPISCLVLDLMDGVDAILGDDFMTNQMLN